MTLEEVRGSVTYVADTPGGVALLARGGYLVGLAVDAYEARRSIGSPRVNTGVSKRLERQALLTNKDP